MDLLEELLDKVKEILQDVNEIDKFIVNENRAEAQLKAVAIRNNANDLIHIFNLIKNS